MRAEPHAPLHAVRLPPDLMVCGGARELAVQAMLQMSTEQVSQTQTQPSREFEVSFQSRWPRRRDTALLTCSSGL